MQALTQVLTLANPKAIAMAQSHSPDSEPELWAIACRR